MSAKSLPYSGNKLDVTPPRLNGGAEENFKNLEQYLILLTERLDYAMAQRDRAIKELSEALGVQEQNFTAFKEEVSKKLESL